MYFAPSGPRESQPEVTRDPPRAQSTRNFLALDWILISAAEIRQVTRCVRYPIFAYPCSLIPERTAVEVSQMLGDVSGCCSQFSVRDRSARAPRQND